MFLLSGLVNVVLFLTTRRVLPMHSVLPKKLSSIFRSSVSEGSSRDSTFSASSFSSDPEKPILSYEENRRERNYFAPQSALPSPAPMQYTASTPQFAIGSATSETFGRIPHNSAGVSRRSFEEIDIAGAPYHDDSGYR